MLLVTIREISAVVRRVWTGPLVAAVTEFCSPSKNLRGNFSNKPNVHNTFLTNPNAAYTQYPLVGSLPTTMDYLWLDSCLTFSMVRTRPNVACIRALLGCSQPLGSPTSSRTPPTLHPVKCS